MGGSVDIAPGGESLYYCLEPKVFIDLIQHCNLSSGDGPLLMLIGCGLLSRLRPFLPWSRSEYLHDLYESFVTLLKHGGSRMLASSSVCLADDLCTSGATLCFPLGEPLSAFHDVIKRLGCSLLPHGSSAPAFLVVVSSSEVYQGTWPGKAVVRWSEPWIWNLEAGIRNMDDGTRNPEV
ncbi:hypothetical protein YC2023_018580 [Brassica napus]